MESIILITWLAFLCGIFVSRVYQLFSTWRQLQRNSRQFPNVEVIKDGDERCVQHSWGTVFLAVRALEPKSYATCSKCGFVSGTQYRLNKPGLEVFHAALKRKEKSMSVITLRQESLDLTMNDLVRDHVVMLSDDVHNNIEVLRTFARKTITEYEATNAEIDRELEDG